MPRPSSLLARSSWPTLAAGGAGVLALGGLALTGAAEPTAATALAVAVAGVSLWQAMRVAPDRPVAELLQEPATLPRAAPTAYADLALAGMPDPLMVIAASAGGDLASRRFVLANAAARELLRIQRDEGVLVGVVRDPQVLEAVDTALFAGKSADAVFAVPGAQDRRLAVLARPLGVAADGARLALLVFRDETELRRMEQTRVDFLANASHELRTPLASLIGFIDTLRGHAKTDEAARERFLGIMQGQAERMSRLIDDLMSLSRIELNEHVRPAGAVELASTVKDVVDALGPLAQARGVRIETRLPPPGEALVVGDRDQIVQVVQNLADNALKYSPAGCSLQIEVLGDISAEAATASSRPQAARLPLLTPDFGALRYAAVRIGDHGPGIAREHLPRLTERFYRVEGQKSGDRLGTGLGLAIVKHIVSRHRGALAVESALGEGTVFTAAFPLADQTAAAAAPAQSAAPAEV